MIIKKNKKSDNQYNNQEKSAKKQDVEKEELNTDLVFDINDIDFNSRIERRQGDRRRGYRRIDDRSLVSRAQQEAINIKDNAKIEGYQEGLKNAEQDISNLTDAIITFMSAKEKIYDEVAPKILEISMEVAKKIIKKEVETDKDIILGMIKEALEKLNKNEKQIVIKVSPEDKEYVKNNIDNLLEKLQIEAKISVQQDIKLSMGSVIVETNNGLVDASIDTGLQIIEEMFKTIQGD